MFAQSFFVYHAFIYCLTNLIKTEFKLHIIKKGIKHGFFNHFVANIGFDSIDFYKCDLEIYLLS